MSKGEHPFGQRLEREINIINGVYSLKDISRELVQERIEEFEHMISMMIKSDPKLRSKASKLINHVFFWNNDKKLKVIQEISDKLEYNPPANMSQQSNESPLLSEKEKEKEQ